MLAAAAIFSVSSGLGYLLPALIGLESMGVPSPGETALVLAAVLASQGKLNIWLVILIAAASAITGDNLGYLLGRHFGREVLTSRGPFHERRAKVIAIGDRYFEKHGAKTVFIGRWLALIRFATAWLAGINGMRYRTFLFWNALSGSLWALAYGLAGYYGGNAVAHVLERVGIVAAVLLIVLFVGVAVVVKLRERRARHHPEAATETVAPEAPAETDAPQAAAETVAGAGDPAGSPAEQKR